MKRTKVKSKLRIQQIFTISFLLFISLNLISIPTYAQVTIGSNLEPEKAAVLDIKEKADKDGGPTVEKGGLILPRVNLEKKKQLYPFIREKGYSASNYDNASYDPNVADPDYAKEKPAHKGLIVYNLTENEEEELCLGLNQWDGEEWNCFEEKMGNAIAHIVNCDDFKVFGLYKSPDKYPDTPSDDVSLDASNYVTIKLKVTKPGAYTITVTPKYAAAQNDETNGYFFTANGVFMEKGVYNVILQGSGTPFWYTPKGNIGDEVTVVMNDKPLTLENGTICVKDVQVADYSKKPNFEMDCGRTTVHGVYQQNKELDPTSNYISVWITMNPSDSFVEGSTVYLETDVVDGISFASVPTLITAADKAAGEKEIILRGKGKPTTTDTKKMTITSNSSTSVATCYANVSVAFTVKKTYGWGYYENTAGYLMQSGSGIGKIADANVNFGTEDNSTVKVVKYSPTQTFNHATLSGGSAYSPSNIKAMFDQNPEITLTGFDLAIADASNRSQVVNYMVDYLNKSGILIFVCERDYMAKSFFEALYPGLTVKASGLISTIRLQFGFFNDEILNGPFGDIRGKFYGNDAGGTISISGLPEQDIIVYARDSNGNPTMFQHKFYNLIFLGDGGIFANYNGQSGSTTGTATTYPVTIDSNSRPITKTSWSGGDVENARLFANIMAWAVKTAQTKGIYAPK